MKYKVRNILSEGLSGKVGKKVYYQLHGQTYVRKAPKKGYNKMPTEKQAAARVRFKEALRFAKSVVSDPVLKVLYEKKAGIRSNAYHAAMSEFLAKRKTGLESQPSAQTG